MEPKERPNSRGCLSNVPCRCPHFSSCYLANGPQNIQEPKDAQQWLLAFSGAGPEGSCVPRPQNKAHIKLPTEAQWMHLGPGYRTLCERPFLEFKALVRRPWRGRGDPYTGGLPGTSFLFMKAEVHRSNRVNPTQAHAHQRTPVSWGTHRTQARRHRAQGQGPNRRLTLGLKQRVPFR